MFPLQDRENGISGTIGYTFDHKYGWPCDKVFEQILSQTFHQNLVQALTSIGKPWEALGQLPNTYFTAS